MNKNRVLSLILTLIMLFTVSFPTGVFAEAVEVQEPDTVAAVTVVEVVEETAAVEETPAVAENEETPEQPDEDEAVEVEEEPETSAEEASEPVEEQTEAGEAAEASAEEALFVEGYVRVNRGANVYIIKSTSEEIGSFDSDAIVYAVVNTRAENEADTWLQIFFDTAEARESNEALPTGYVQFKDVVVLPENEAAELIGTLENDAAVRSAKEHLLPVVNFTVFYTEATEEVPQSDVKESTQFAITKNPYDVTAEVGDTVTFSVTATGSGLSYQWQYSKDGGASWITTKALTGYNTKTLTVPVTAVRIGWQFHCIVTDGSGKSLTSGAATLKQALAITQDPVDVAANVGDTVTFSVEAIGSDLSYQWQYSKDGGETWITTRALTGYNTNTLTVPVTAARIDWQFHCIVTDGTGNSLTSGAATLTRLAIVINDVTYENLTETTCRIASYSGTASSLVIPGTVEGMTVTEVGEEAFMDNKYLVSIDLPDTITVIRARAFKNCSNLSEMK